MILTPPRCGALMNAAFRVRAQLLARIYGVAPLKCSGCGGRVRVVGFITEPATVRQILAHVGEPTTAPAIALARSPPVEANAQQLMGPEAVEAIPELEFDQTANLTAEAEHDSWWPTRVRMQSRSRSWSSTRRWVGNSALQKWFMWRSVCRCGSDAGLVR